MSIPAHDSVPVGIDADKVSAWLSEHVAGATAPFRFQLIAGGRSNLTYAVTGADGQRFVVRRPPLGMVLATAHDMGREFRIISGVGKTDVPVAPALGYCEDVAVNGAPFYVMGFVDGVVLDSPEAGRAYPLELRGPITDDLIAVMARLHAVEPDAVGLGSLAKREAYLERQLRRWSSQWEQSKTREIPLMDELAKTLASRMPPQIYTGIAHGDYRLGNCLSDPKTGKIAAVLDWELCTLGDTLADLGYLLVYWNDPGETHTTNDPSGIEGFCRSDDLVAAYSKATGRDVSNIAYYQAFATWKLACIAEGVLARYMGGVMAEDSTSVFDTTLYSQRVEELAQRAHDLLVKS